MFEALARAPEIYQPSKFWKELNDVHVRQLEEAGFEQFKRTINLRYFNWKILGILRHQALAVFLQWARKPAFSVFGAGLAPSTNGAAKARKVFNPLAAQVYATYVAMLAEVVSRQDPLNLLSTLEEPALGNPLDVVCRGRRISQDLCNSIHEFYSIVGRDGHLEDQKGRRLAFAELGAGYGRLAPVFLSSLPQASYCIIDIPPVLYVSQEYLTRLYSRERIFKFREFKAYRDVQAEFEGAALRFLMPHQMEILPDGVFDTMINISSLHEMTLAQVRNFLNLEDRLCRGRVYLKQWKVSSAKVNGQVIRQADYPIPGRWQSIYQEAHPIQRLFFHALYQVGEGR